MHQVSYPDKSSSRSLAALPPYTGCPVFEEIFSSFYLAFFLFDLYHTTSNPQRVYSPCLLPVTVAKDIMRALLLLLQLARSNLIRKLRINDFESPLHFQRITLSCVSPLPPNLRYVLC